MYFLLFKASRFKILNLQGYEPIFQPIRFQKSLPWRTPKTLPKSPRLLTLPKGFSLTPFRRQFLQGTDLIKWKHWLLGANDEEVCEGREELVEERGGGFFGNELPGEFVDCVSWGNK